ncbi:ABC transporter permease [Paracoccus sp. MC1862]|uniref:ABC transporter permease n=1 Tax=Paracoccus sp. MC1862 TaxID=2760307 RepID=UPI001603114E|nr:iron chelate uptake ABC transporter family permease subunit [Paracoccus sp. MC1862]MBB1499589.1 iron chelate uptake ABC transporter family permease subunit [Paracoccus sp. MC1862]QQO44207.1 iron chelate uptake ABC transporter family permease subunit [Paracoccus sp. MC1862]
MKARPLVAGLALAALTLASLGVGAAQIDLRGAGDGWTTLVLMESRLPRTLAVLLTGAALAVAGVVIQSLVRNRFVGPDTAGTGESAALGLLGITLLAPAAPIWIKMVAASLAAMAGTALFLAIVRRLPVREVMLVPIAGLILSGIIGSVVTWIAWEADLLQFVNTWLMSGEFSGIIAGRYELLWIAGAAAGLAWFAADRFAILSLGDQVATGLGLSTRGVMRLGMVVVSVVSALVVTTVGMIPFVGLVVPNIVARVMGDNLRASIPVVAAGGAGLLLACDLIGRIVRHPYEIPVGTILGIIGSVIFLWLLYRPPVRG